MPTQRSDVHEKRGHSKDRLLRGWATNSRVRLRRRANASWGQRCQYSVRPDIGFFRGFRIPGDWGGTLTVVWTLETFTSKWIPIASQAAAARYRLNGTSDGCDLLFASGSPFPHVALTPRVVTLTSTDGARLREGPYARGMATTSQDSSSPLSSDPHRWQRGSGLVRRDRRWLGFSVCRFLAREPALTEGRLAIAFASTSARTRIAATPGAHRLLTLR
jgi:hypothetical protein